MIKKMGLCVAYYYLAGAVFGISFDSDRDEATWGEGAKWPGVISNATHGVGASLGTITMAAVRPTQAGSSVWVGYTARLVDTVTPGKPYKGGGTLGDSGGEGFGACAGLYVMNDGMLNARIYRIGFGSLGGKRYYDLHRGTPTWNAKHGARSTEVVDVSAGDLDLGTFPVERPVGAYRAPAGAFTTSSLINAGMRAEPSGGGHVRGGSKGTKGAGPKSSGSRSGGIFNISGGQTGAFGNTKPQRTMPPVGLVNRPSGKMVRRIVNIGVLGAGGTYRLDGGTLYINHRDRP